jgi:hypothetical protein
MRMPPKPDSGHRGADGLCVSVAVVRSGFLLSFDDCVRAGDGRWQSVGFFTHLELTRRELQQIDLTRDQLADIGLAVVARLQAATSRSPALSQKRVGRKRPSSPRQGSRQRGSPR